MSMTRGMRNCNPLFRALKARLGARASKNIRLTIKQHQLC